jgi:hypothetical protein
MPPGTSRLEGYIQVIRKLHLIYYLHALVVHSIPEPLEQGAPVLRNPVTMFAIAGAKETEKEGKHEKKATELSDMDSLSPAVIDSYLVS